jgi:hypothetical protein
VTKRERSRVARLEKRCDWLEARIAIAADKGRCLNFDVAELSALRWAIERITTSPDALWDENRRLQAKITNQRMVIRNLVAYQQRISLSDEELDALIDAAMLAGDDAAQHIKDNEE